MAVGPTNRPLTRPRAGRDIPEVDLDASLVTYELLGIVFGSVAHSSDENVFKPLVDRAIRNIDEERVDATSMLGAVDFATADGLVWPLASGLASLAPTGDVYFVQAGGKIRRLDLSAAQLAQVGEATHTFPANTRVWVYSSGAALDKLDQVGGQGTSFPAAAANTVDLYFHDVGVGGFPAPPVGYVVVAGVDTDATDVTANLVTSTFTSIVLGWQVKIPWTWNLSTDETAVSIFGSNTFAPTVLIGHVSGVAGGNLLVLSPDPSSSAAALAIDHTGSGLAATFSKTSGGGDTLTVSNGGGGAGTGAAARLSSTAAAEDTVVISASLRAPLRLTQQTGDPSGSTNGQVWVRDSDREGLSWHNNGSTKRGWGTEQGLETASDYTPGEITSVNADTTIQSVPVNFRQNRWYLISVGCALRCDNPSAYEMRVEVNGTPAPRAPAKRYVISTATGANVYSDRYDKTFKFQWTAADLTANVTLHLDSQPGNPDTFAAADRDITVTGHFDTA